MDDLLGPLADEDWDRPVPPCPGWTVADVVLHLAQTNEMATASASGRLEAAGEVWVGEPGATVDDMAADAVDRERGAVPGDLLDRWRRGASDMVRAFEACDPAARVPWAVGDMAARTLATTRIAEGWIHTGDVAVALDVLVEPTDRLWHIARLVHRTVPYAFDRAGQGPPGPVRFELTPPGGGDPWVFGDDGAPTTVRGPALDLCRVAGQRATAAETALRADGPDADDVLRLVRTFA
ncbi:MAG: maleylpyruvate isomerase family mycothiol-dependent enzyme [Actinomycetota bacterium]